MVHVVDLLGPYVWGVLVYRAGHQLIDHRAFLRKKPALSCGFLRLNQSSELPPTSARFASPMARQGMFAHEIRLLDHLRPGRPHLTAIL